MSYVPTRYSAANIDNDIWLTFARTQFKGQLAEKQYIKLHIKLIDVKNSIDYKEIHTQRAIEAAVCIQFPDGDKILARAVKRGVERKYDRRRILGLLIYFLHSLNNITLKDIGYQYNKSEKVISGLRKNFLKNLEKDSKLQRLYENVCKELIKKGAKKIEKLK